MESVQTTYTEDDFPSSLFDFTRRFSTEEACWDYLVKVRWPNGIPTHPKTGEPFKYFLEDRKVWKFHDGYQLSATAGTVMERTKIPLTKWFWAAYLVATHTPGISALQLSKQFGVRYETIYMMLQKLRRGLVNPEREKLTKFVEVDETFIGGKGKGTRGRGATGKALVAGAVEVNNFFDKKGNQKSVAGRVRLQIIENASAVELEKFVKENVEEKSTIHTDGWLGYSNVKSLGYDHQVATGASSKIVAENLVHIHRVFSNLKTWLLGTHHGVDAKHLQVYLDEFTFRFNRRDIPFHAFLSVLSIGSQVPGVQYKEIYAN